MKPLVGTGCLLLFLVVSLFLIVPWNEASAEQFRFQWGASLSLSEQYDDNVRITSEGKEDDWITQNSAHESRQNFATRFMAIIPFCRLNRI